MPVDETEVALPSMGTAVIPASNKMMGLEGEEGAVAAVVEDLTIVDVVETLDGVIEVEGVAVDAEEVISDTTDEDLPLPHLVEDPTHLRLVEDTEDPAVARLPRDLHLAPLPTGESAPSPDPVHGQERPLPVEEKFSAAHHL